MVSGLFSPPLIRSDGSGVLVALALLEEKKVYAMALTGQQLGHSRLVRLIGQGGMGEVYLAEDTRISRQVAVKVVRDEHQPYPDFEAMQQAGQHFQREMKAISLLDHPHILSFYDFGEEPAPGGSIIYMVMPYRPEGSLVDWLIRHGPNLPALQDAGYMITQAASTLQHAHDHHIVHRDVKPSNFLVRTNTDYPTRPDLFLVDFGIARIMSATSTASNSVRGTSNYMAPEQWSGDAVPATDQYALAVMAYQLLTGRLPFQGRPEQLMFQHLTLPPKPPSEHNPHLSPAVDVVILRALAKKVDERFPTIKAFAIALQQAFDYTDLNVTLPLTKAETLQGGNRTIMLPGNRQVMVTIPPDAQHGQKLHLPDQGIPYYDNGPRGPLQLILSTDQTKAASSYLEADKHKVPIVSTSSKSAKQSPPTVDTSDPQLPTNMASLPPSGVDDISPLPVGPTDNRNKLPNQRSILLVAVALLLIVGSALAVVFVNNVVAINKTHITGTLQASVRATNSTATAQAQATASTIAANPDPYPPTTGRLVLSDSLRNASEGTLWRVDPSCQFAGDGYHAALSSRGGAYYVNCNSNTSFRNFAFQIQMKMIKGDCGGIIFREDSVRSTFYYFSVCQNQSYLFYIYNAASSGNVWLSGSSSAIKQGVGQPNVIAVVANGSRINLYVNKQLVNSLSDNTYSYGQIGVTADTHFGNPTEVIYTDAKVWTL